MNIVLPKAQQLASDFFHGFNFNKRIDFFIYNFFVIDMGDRDNNQDKRNRRAACMVVVRMVDT